jgi:tRNA threonylcarbamoyladenosine biosynthesis protein TsaE
VATNINSTNPLYATNPRILVFWEKIYAETRKPGGTGPGDFDDAFLFFSWFSGLLIKILLSHLVAALPRRGVGGFPSALVQNMTRLVFDAPDEAATVMLGHALADCLPPGSVVALSGALGSGKTRLVQAVAEAAGVGPREVVSPTFVLIHEYRGRLPIYHFDVYRLKDEDEFLQLGPEEYFDAGGWTFVEWADRVANFLPPQRLEIHLEPLSVNSRRFEIIAVGEFYRPVVAALSERLRLDGGPE